MNFKKGLSALALLLALTVVGCNGNKESSKPAASSAPANAQKSSTAPSSAKASSSAAPSSQAPAVTYPMPVAHTWTEGTKGTNADGKEYIQLNDATANKVGVKILAKDAVPAEGKNFDGGKIGPVNDEEAYVTWKVKAPKAGNYQMVMRAKTSSSGEGYAFTNRGLRVLVGETECEVYGDRQREDAGLDTENFNEFVVAQPVALTGNEDTITLYNPHYRIVFDITDTAYVVFAEL